MILMNIKLDNFLVFNDFELCTSYPKKIVGSGIGEEHLEGKPNFRYKKLVVLMGANATGKTALGHILMYIFSFISKKEYSGITNLIEDKGKKASFVIDMVMEGAELYRVSAVFNGLDDIGGYKSNDISVSVKNTSILANDNYERCIERLNAMPDSEYSSYITALEQVPNFSWGFEFSTDMIMIYRTRMENFETYHKVLRETLMTLDPRIEDVTVVERDKGTLSIRFPNFSILMNQGMILTPGVLSAGTVDGIGIAEMIAAMKVRYADFYYCDEKFSHIHSEAEKAFLSLLIDLIEPNQQLFITTHNSDILDMDIPKHSFAFLRRDETYDNHISCVFASDFLKKNTDSLKNAVENDVFSASPDISRIYMLKDI